MRISNGSNTIKIYALAIGAAIVATYSPPARAADVDHTLDDPFALSLEQLVDLPVATLTTAETRETPASVTTIDREMIDASGARTLNELLDIFVPNVQIMRHNFGLPHVGVRGVIGDRDDKYLLLVNGKVMNHRTQEGAFTERDLQLLGDIRHIDVIRGPGSAIYGPGAVSGVVNVVTLDGRSFDGVEVTGRVGGVDQFASMEARAGARVGESGSLFAYYGIADVSGSSQSDSPLVYGVTGTSRGGEVPVRPGEPIAIDVPDDGRMYRGRAKHKLHAGYRSDDLSIWVRWTRGGMDLPSERGTLLDPPEGRDLDQMSLDEISSNEFGYHQFTALGEYDWKLDPRLNLEFTASYDALDFERLRDRPDLNTRSYLESEIYGRILAHWRPGTAHTIAGGISYSREMFGRSSPGFPDLPPATQRQPEVQPWDTDTWSFMAEDRWRMGDRVTTFLGLRADNHTYTDIFWSPRLAVVLDTGAASTLKAIANRSQRRAGDDELRHQWLETETFADPEEINALELRYDQGWSRPWSWAVVGYFNDVDIVARNSLLERNVLLGEFQTWGVELELRHHGDRDDFRASHGYTNLIDFTLEDATSIQGFSAKPYGYGNDLANWSNHVTKLAYTRHLSDRWQASTSLRVYWEFAGARDQTEWNSQLATPSFAFGLADAGYDEAFGANVYWNLGAEYRPTPRLRLRLDGYNLAGLFDEELNKRNYILRVSDYRSEATALALTVAYRF